jgi:hypothetical protein
MSTIGNRLKYLMIFNRGIDTMKITALLCTLEYIIKS